MAGASQVISRFTVTRVPSLELKSTPSSPTMTSSRASSDIQPNSASQESTPITPTPLRTPSDVQPTLTSLESTPTPTITPSHVSSDVQPTLSSQEPTLITPTPTETRVTSDIQPASSSLDSTPISTPTESSVSSDIQPASSSTTKRSRRRGVVEAPFPPGDEPIPELNLYPALMSPAPTPTHAPPKFRSGDKSPRMKLSNPLALSRLSEEIDAPPEDLEESTGDNLAEVAEILMHGSPEEKISDPADEVISSPDFLSAEGSTDSQMSAAEEEPTGSDEEISTHGATTENKKFSIASVSSWSSFLSAMESVPPFSRVTSPFFMEVIDPEEDPYLENSGSPTPIDSCVSQDSFATVTSAEAIDPERDPYPNPEGSPTPKASIGSSDSQGSFATVTSLDPEKVQEPEKVIDPESCKDHVENPSLPEEVPRVRFRKKRNKSTPNFFSQTSLQPTAPQEAIRMVPAPPEVASAQRVSPSRAPPTVPPRPRHLTRRLGLMSYLNLQQPAAVRKLSGLVSRPCALRTSRSVPSGLDRLAGPGEGAARAVSPPLENYFRRNVTLTFNIVSDDDSFGNSDSFTAKRGKKSAAADHEVPSNNHELGSPTPPKRSRLLQRVWHHSHDHHDKDTANRPPEDASESHTQTPTRSLHTDESMSSSPWRVLQRVRHVLLTSRRPSSPPPSSTVTPAPHTVNMQVREESYMCADCLHSSTRRSPPEQVEDGVEEGNRPWHYLHLSRARLQAAASTSELFAAFAMVALVELQINTPCTVPDAIWTLFSVCTALLVGVNVLALTITTHVLPAVEAAARLHPTALLLEERGMRRFVQLAWACATFLGLALYFFEVTLLSWVKFWDLAVEGAVAATVIAGISLIAFLAVVVHFCRNLEPSSSSKYSHSSSQPKSASQKQRSNRRKQVGRAAEEGGSKVSWRCLHVALAKLEAAAATSELIAGFATMAVVELQTNTPTAIPRWLFVFLAVNTTLLALAHVFALMIATFLMPSIKAVRDGHSINSHDENETSSLLPPPHERMRPYIEAAWTLSTLIGMLLFLLEVGILCWIKFLDFSIVGAAASSAVMACAVIAFTGFTAHFWHVLVRHRGEAVDEKRLAGLARQLSTMRKLETRSRLQSPPSHENIVSLE